MVYNYLKSIRQNQYLVIGPNPVFLKYTKSVLPELDVAGVERCTFEQFAQKILEYKEKGYRTIAVISKTNLLSNYINDDLAERGMQIPNVGIDDDLSDERFNICTISNQLAKGLEFDAVIVNDASENVYSSDNGLGMKLLYVAITRALHEIEIIYSDELT